MKINQCPFCASSETQVIKAIVGNDWSVECMTCDSIGPSQDGSDTAILSWNKGSPRWKQFFKMQTALERIRDCDWPGPIPLAASRADFMQQIAREALE